MAFDGLDRLGCGTRRQVDIGVAQRLDSFRSWRDRKSKFNREIYLKNNDSTIHLGAIRKAFSNRNAAVMVGAGFSRNAVGGENLATWPMVANALWNALNPSEPETSFPTSSVTQLGEQYARVFSVPSLENLLKQLIPDDKVTPGALHDQLLRLPWSEIFTTNYDTLLERAAEKILDRAHFTVCCREDIPMSKILDRRRIVKLHGSFPSQRPFIFTEESYRKYPQDFAPFVNLVRQSLLENVFCLIGFSGDDPNFLHWIGWVRDMLDEHTLPIYLFVHVEPNLGQRRLLEARRVVPVVVPSPSGSEENDYISRYQELFKLLREPIDSDDGEWGKFTRDEPGQFFPRDKAAQLQSLVSHLPILVAQRASYPGWLVAPISVRRNFKHSVERLSWHLESPSAFALDCQPYALVAIFSYYVWQQNVLLGPIIDDIAQAAVNALEITAEINADSISKDPTGVLAAMGIRSKTSFLHTWTDACVGALRWARQELRLDAFAKIRLLLKSNPVDDRIADEIAHQEVLLDLYLGDLAEARQHLDQWQPRSADPYMQVLKGSLLSEVGDVDAGLVSCMSGIQQLREVQRINRKGAGPASSEAWGCLVANNIVQAKKFGRMDFASEVDQELLEDFGARLSGLAGKGFDVKREYREITSALNAEAQRPSVPRYRFYEFDLGHSNITQRFGQPGELRSKIDAAESWLNLADRVGLAPRLGRVRFSVDEYTQAAWWIQYNNTPWRMLSVAIRTGEDDIFKPKDETIPQHKTGWLSRYQVSLFSSGAATEICDRALRQVEHLLAPGGRSQRDNDRACKFNIELFSRMSLRVEDLKDAKSFALRVIALHCGESLQDRPMLWESFGHALDRSLEALPPHARTELLDKLIQIPYLPDHAAIPHYLDSWPKPLRRIPISRSELAPNLRILLDREIESLVNEVAINHQLQSEQHRARLPFAWDRLFALDRLGCISEEVRHSIGRMLWRDVQSWPSIPLFSPTAVLIWPSPENVDLGARLRELILSWNVEPFSTPSAEGFEGATFRRTWAFHQRDDFLKTWIASQEKQAWPAEDVIAGLMKIKAWWEAEIQAIEKDLSRLEELKVVFVKRLSRIDEILYVNADLIFRNPSQLDSHILEWLAQLLPKAKSLGCPMWRFRWCRSLHSDDRLELESVQIDLAAALASTEVEEKWDAVEAMKAWIARSESNSLAPDLVLDTVFSIVLARKMPGLMNCMDLVQHVVQHKRDWVTLARSQMLATGMKLLLSELNYTARIPGSGISDEYIPLLRYFSAKIAFTAAANGEMFEWIQTWVNAASTDPLPELRFFSGAELNSNET